MKSIIAAITLILSMGMAQASPFYSLSWDSNVNQAGFISHGKISEKDGLLISHMHIESYASFTVNTDFWDVIMGKPNFMWNLALWLDKEKLESGVYKDAMSYNFDSSANGPGFSLSIHNGPYWAVSTIADFEITELSLDSKGKIQSLAFDFLVNPYNSSGRNENLWVKGNFNYHVNLPVPEPQSYALLALGLGVLGCTAQRKTKQTT